MRWEFHSEGIFRDAIPKGQGFYGASGFNVNWFGFEVWAGSRKDVCGFDDPGAPPHGYALPPPGGPSGLVYTIQLRLPTGEYYDAHGPWGSPGLEFPVAAYATVPVSAPTDFVVEGSVTLAMDVEEWKEMEIDASAPRVPLDYATSGAEPPDDDFVGLSVLRYYEGPKAGGSFSFDIEVTDGYGCSGSGSIPSGNDGPWPEAHRPTAREFIAPAPADPVTGSLTVMKLNGAPVNFDELDYTDDAVEARGGDDGELTLEAAAMGDDNPVGPYLAQCLCSPDIEIGVDGLTTKQFEDNYGESVDYRRSWADPVSKTNGLYAGETERVKDEWVYLERCDDGVANTLFQSLRFAPDLFLWLDNDWMVAKGEIPKDWRILIADDYEWAPIEVLHLPGLVVEDFSSTSGWSATNVTLTSDGSHLRITASGGTGSATKEYDEDASQYRRLRFRAKADADTTVRVTLNNSGLHYWDVPLTTRWKTVDLDLCAPHGASAAYDRTDNSYVEPGDYFGPRRITRIAIGSIGSGREVYCDLVMFVRDTATVTALPPFDESFVGDDGVRRWRLSWGLCDGRQVFDLPYRVDDGMSDRFLTVAEFVEEMETHPAHRVRLHGGPATEAGEYYYNHSERLAAFFATERYPMGRRENLLDQPVSEPRELVWLQRYDMVGVYPGIGDPAGGFDTPYPLRFTKRLQCSAHGLVVDPAAHAAVAGAEVALKLDGSTEQTVATDEVGYYRTGPFRPLAGEWSVNDVPLTTGLTDRKSRWAGLAGEAGAPGETACVADETGRVYVAHSRGSGLWVRRVSLTGGVEEFPVRSGVSGFGIAWSAPHRLHVIAAHSGGIGMLVSRDDGETWEVEVAVFDSGDFPNIVADSVTGLLFAFRHNGIGIGCRRSLDGGETWEEEATVVASCPAQRCGVTSRPDGAGTILVSYVDVVGAVRLASSLDNGLTWE